MLRPIPPSPPGVSRLVDADATWTMVVRPKGIVR